MYATFKGTLSSTLLRCAYFKNYCYWQWSAASSLIPITPICCLLFRQITQCKCQCVLTGAEYVVLFYSKLASLSLGSPLLLLKRKTTHTHTHMQKCTLVKPLREIKSGRDMRVFLDMALDKETEVPALQSKILNRQEEKLF